MDVSPVYATLSRHERHLQRLVHGRQDFSVRWIKVHGDEDPALAVWLAGQLKLADAPALLAQAPVLPRLIWQGWIAYYRGDYLAAAARFAEAWTVAETEPAEDADRAEIALGFGKVYTRSGHWQAARAWLLHALACYREDERLFGLVQGYGALGELMLRGGQPQAANACMSTAYHLLPPGSGQQARQLNYLASTLMRIGARLRAESLLMTSLHMAHDGGDADSVWHALARLQFLALDQDPAPSGVDMLETLRDYVPASPTPVAQAFLHIGRAIQHWRQQCIPAARQCLTVAREAVQSLPGERQWVQALIDTLDGGQTASGPALHTLLNLLPEPAPAQTSIVDRTWAAVPLPTQNGFAVLATTTDSFDTVCGWRSRFFI